MNGPEALQIVTEYVNDALSFIETMDPEFLVDEGEDPASRPIGDEDFPVDIALTVLGRIVKQVGTPTLAHPG